MGTTPHEVDLLDSTPFVMAAGWAMASLAVSGSTLVEIAPNDSTLYRVSIVDTAFGALHQDGQVSMGAMGGGRFLVASNHGPLYAWSGQSIHHSYVAEHYVTDHSPWTARVLARFLNLLAAAMETPA